MAHYDSFLKGNLDGLGISPDPKPGEEKKEAGTATTTQEVIQFSYRGPPHYNIVLNHLELRRAPHRRGHPLRPPRRVRKLIRRLKRFFYGPATPPPPPPPRAPSSCSATDPDAVSVNAGAGAVQASGGTVASASVLTATPPPTFSAFVLPAGHYGH